MPVMLSLVGAVLYALAALFIKLAILRGASSWSVTFYSNLASGSIFLPLLLFGHGTWHPSQAWLAVAAGVLFFVGQIATFRSIASGDVSIATPALSSKVVFVALLSLAIGARPDRNLWVAVGLTMAGMLLLHRGPRGAHATRPMVTLGWALLAALVFSAADVLVQAGSPRARPGAWRWGAAGIGLLAVQILGVGAAIGVYGNATAVNVIYGSRGLWSVVLAAMAVRFLRITEGTRDRRTLLYRLAGSLLILSAVVVAVL